ncbi:acyl carrier protein [Pseudomonas japonica]|uniref:acyl carrier protein n=1 Tax=Pseudomonas japonica TaxID=256466 RepID=UPI003800A231
MADPHSEMVIRCIVERLGLDRPPPVETRLIDLGMDSLDIVELLEDINKETGETISVKAISEGTTVSQLTALTRVQ